MKIIDRAKAIIMSPKIEWGTIAGEEPNIGQIMTGYVLPLALIPAIASVIGYGLIGSGEVVSVSYGIARALIQVISAFIVVYLAAFVIDFLAPNFASQKGIGRAVQLVAYSNTPVWIAGIVYIIPGLSWIVFIAALYSLYILYLGFSPMMKTPQDKVVVYLVVSIIALIIVYAIVGWILALILLPLFGVGALATGAMGM